MKKIFFVLLLMSTAMAHAQTYKVMTYNIRLDTPVDSVNQWPKRTGKVYALIKKYDPDMLGVQEAIHHQLMGIVDNLTDYAYVGVGRDDGKTKGEYSALLYKKDKFDVIDQNTFWLSETPDVPGSKSWDAAITRVASWAILKDKKTKAEFLVINTHFDHMGKEARKNSAALLKQKAVTLNKKKLPVIITGDFNCTREEAPYSEMMDPKGLSVIDAAPKEPPGTFCGFKVGAMKCRPIDYIFYTQPWKASDYTVIEDNDGTYYPSDHLPVIVTLKLK